MRRLVALLVISIVISIASIACADLQAHFLDVGHGDCIIIMCDGAAMVVDGGGAAKSDLLYTYLTKQEITHVQAVIGTHPDNDHVGGLPAVFHAATVGTLYVPIIDHTAERHTVLIEKAHEMGTEIVIPNNGDSFTLGAATVTFYKLPKEAQSDNDLSLVTHIVYGKHSFLLCADIDKDYELALMNGGYDLKATVLKVAHHGSDASSSMQFLAASHPAYAIISGNSQYESPKDEVPAKIIAEGSTLLHTKQNGHIVITSTGEKIKIKTSRNYVGNSGTFVFHEKGCRHVKDMKAKNKSTIYTREQAIATGYTPCKTCDP